jgi:hypothetical protein
MNPEEIMLNQQQMGADAQLHQGQSAQTQSAMMLEQTQASMLTEQLDLSEERERIENLLRKKVHVRNKETNMMEWMDAPDGTFHVLTEEGINEAVNFLSFYLNKNTLLSNYDEDTIRFKMEDLAKDFSDLLFMNYDIFFHIPTTKECYDIFQKQLKQKAEDEFYKLKIKNPDIPDEEQEKIYQKLIKETDIERGVEQVREKGRKDRLKHYNIIVRVIQDSIHSTYQRAWGGKERSSFRKQVHVSESPTLNIQSQYPQSKLNPLNWLRR